MDSYCGGSHISAGQWTLPPCVSGAAAAAGMCHHAMPPPNHMPTGCMLSHHAVPGPGPPGPGPGGGGGSALPPPPQMVTGCPGLAAATGPHHGSIHGLPGALGHGPSMLSLHQIPPPPTLCNPCSNTNNFNSVPLPGPSSSASVRWGPRSSCPVHSPYRIRMPNGNVCSGHQVCKIFHLKAF